MILFGININVVVPKDFLDRLMREVQLVQQVKQQAFVTGLSIGLLVALVLFVSLLPSRGK